MKENKTNNTTTYIEVVEKNGKIYKNLINVTTLNNGEIVRYKIKLSFFNHKFAYKLEQNLDERK